MYKIFINIMLGIFSILLKLNEGFNEMKGWEYLVRYSFSYFFIVIEIMLFVFLF